MEIRVLLVGNYPPDHQTSMSAFVRMMENQLKVHGHQVGVVRPRAVFLPPWVKRPRGIWKWVGYVDKFLVFPVMLRRVSTQYDVVHICDQANALHTFWLRRQPTVVTCHDVIAIQAGRGMIPGWHVGPTGRVFQKLIYGGLQRASEIVCVSEHTRNDLLALGRCGEQVSVALTCLNADFHRIAASEASALVTKLGIASDRSYLLHVGSDDPRKNRLFLLQLMGYARALMPSHNWELILVGPPLSDDMHRLAEANHLSGSVHVLSDVTHETLLALYNRATALVFPSTQEGFGMPVLEAQACGCPVFASNLPPMTEVGGSAARYFDPHDPESAAKLLVESGSDLEEMRIAGLHNLERFSASGMISAYLGAYSRARVLAGGL